MDKCCSLPMVIVNIMQRTFLAVIGAGRKLMFSCLLQEMPVESQTYKLNNLVVNINSSPFLRGGFEEVLTQIPFYLC